jgi:putative endonuclease
MSNDKHSVLYTGVTNDIKRRAYEHRNGLVEGFTKKYHVKYLVYYEEFNDVEYAIRREKQIKGGSRKKKELLVNSSNPTWRDLFEDVATF